jgi:hypothetical protein
MDKIVREGKKYLEKSEGTSRRVPVASRAAARVRVEALGR